MGEEDVGIAVLNDGEVERNEPISVEGKQDNQSLVGDIDPCTKNQATETANDIEDLPCTKNQQSETCVKNLVKEASNEEVCSEVSNPILSPRENASSFQTISSQPANNKLTSNDQIGYGEVTSTCSDHSIREENLSEDEHNRDDTSGADSVSHIVLEIPEHASTTGVRKITFKFKKRKDDYDNQSSALAQPMVNEFGDVLSYNNFSKEPNASVNESKEEIGGDLHGRWFPESKSKMGDKAVLENLPTNVKKLLSTGILDGALIKYISKSGKKELSGIIKGGGYLCGCPTCNFTNILSAYEFELHAGGKSRHPNNHIYLENGKPIYNIIQELKTAPLSVLDKVLKDVAGASLNEKSFQVWKASIQQNMEMVKVGKRYRTKHPGVQFSESYSDQWMENNSRPTSCFANQNIHFEQAYMTENADDQKHRIKRPSSHISSSVMKHKKTADGSTKKRDNDLHRLLFMPNGLPDGTDLAYYSRGQRILGGYKQGNGIVCNCCNTEISPSQFEAHAGWSARRQPYRNIYIHSGLTLHDIALSLASGQSLSMGSSDDMCAMCGDGGELISCYGCPRAFHSVCLKLQCVPEGDWYCPFCRDKFGPGKKAVGDSVMGKPIILRLTRVVKAPEPETGGCVICRAQDFSVAKFDDRTVMLCDQCEKEYHVGCLRDSGLCDLKELPKDKWFCCADCDRIHVALQNYVLNGAEAIPASVIGSITKKHVEKGLSDWNATDVQWRILSGKSRYPEHLPLLSRAAAIFRECFDPIVARSGRDLIPVMVYGRNISGQEFGGMYCVVLIVRSVVVCAGLLRIFGKEAAELPLVATSRLYQGKGYFQALFSCIERFLYSLNVEHLVLPAAEEAESIWSNKLGFRKMSQERFLKFTRNLQLTRFKGTSMLEKEVQPVTGTPRQ